MTRNRSAAQRYVDTFGRRSLAAREKRHLPSTRELLTGMPFFGDELALDAAEFAERLLARIPEQANEVTTLGVMVRCLTMTPTPETYRVTADVLLQIEPVRGLDLADCALRCRFYAASAGCHVSAIRVAAECVSIAGADPKNSQERLDLCTQALGWLFFGSLQYPASLKRCEKRHLMFFDDPRQEVDIIGDRLIEKIIERREEASEEAKADFKEATGARPPVDSSHSTSSPAPPPEPKAKPDTGIGVVVIREIGNRTTTEGRRLERELQDMIGKPLRRVPVPELAEVQKRLAAEFPHAVEIIRAILDEIAFRPAAVALRPTILVGPPGSGKTHFARGLLRALDVPHELYPCGGLSDAALAGTARRWSSAEMSLPLALIARFRCASPGVILDEIEKVGTSRHNGNTLDALLGMLERESSRAWHDPYIEAAVDISHIIWIATANGLDGLPAPLRDRCRVMPFPEPGAGHLPTLASMLLRQAIRERGLDDRWALPLTGEELAALANAWPGGSVRRLQRLVDGVLVARDQAASHH